MKSTLLSRAPVGRDHWIGLGAGVVAILIFATVATVLRRPSEPAELTLHEATLDLSEDVMRIYSLRVPRDGTLEIEAVNSAGHCFNLYVAVANRNHRPRRPNEVPLLVQFTSERVYLYQRTARVERGEYHLTLIKSSGEGAVTAPTRVRARLRT